MSNVELRRALGTDKVLDDAPALTAYAIDASIYKVTPQAVAIIESAADMEATLRHARATHTPLTARSGGTNLTGNAIGEGIILEFSRLNRILEINPDARWARVEPGIVHTELNRALARVGLMFAPDPGSGDMCKLGGMLGNNAAGPHTLKYGATKDNVLSMEILLADGTWITARDYRLDEPAFDRLCAAAPAIPRLLDLIRQNLALIQSKKPTVAKNSSGYNLFALADGIAQGRLPLHQLFIGSEGTLGLTREATLKLVPCPAATATGLIHFRNLPDLTEAVSLLRALSPSALEMMDANTLDLIGRARFDIPEDAAATLLVEFDDDAAARLDEAAREMARFDLSAPMTQAFDPEHQAELWRARKAIYPTLYKYSTQGVAAGCGKKPINFADDVVVAAERIPELIAWLTTLFKTRGVAVAIYGHIGDGNAHINPLLNLNDPDDFDQMVALSHEIHQTVIERFGGSLCGEHGDGRVRAEFLPALFGPELYDLFRQVKRLFDPDNLLNPGVKISDTPFTERIDLERLGKQCATCGKCNSVCPVYDVTGEESNAARGWFHIVTAADYTYAQSSRVVEACLNCRSCATVCPAGIDVGALILQKRAEHPNPVADAIFAFQERRVLFEGFLKGAAWTQPLWDNRIGRRLIEWATRPWLRGLAPTARIPAEMILPRLARRTLRERHLDLTRATSNVAYFHGCAANYLDDGVGDAVIARLAERGIRPALPPQRCSGTPIETYGLTDRLRACARFNLSSLAPFDTVVTGCASCTFMLKNYATLFPDGPEQKHAERLAGKVRHISELLVEREQGHAETRRRGGGDERASPMAARSVLPSAGVPSAGASAGVRVTYHASCHLRAAGVSRAPRDLLRQNPNFEFVEMPDADRCAGGAGTFCIKNPEQSAAIFERKRRGIVATGAEIVFTSCPACMIQLQNGLRGQGIAVRHIAEGV
jgi:FAD/FMN-containing dehydrogenase/Fe-S oxidoreductase